MQNTRGNYTEYCYNMGSVGGYSYAWCASYVSWCLLQSGATNQNTQGAWCRNHEGDKNYIWREVGCYRWYNQLKRFGYGHADDGKYTPKSGDLIFFETSEHIGIVRYAKNGTVYTIEGNTSSGAFNAEGGAVVCKSYKIGGGKIRGYGSLPYKKVDNAKKVDYSGENPTPGLWIGESDVNLYTSNTLSGSSTKIPKGTAFTVTKVVSKDCLEVKYDNKTGYVKKASIYQMTSTVASSSSSATTPSTSKPTEAPVTPNKFAIDEAIKQNADHIGSGITKYKVDGSAVKESDSYTISAGQKFGIEGFAGFKSPINEFGYYFDGNAQGAVWGVLPKTATADVKSKAGDNAKLFDIEADTSALTDGVHTLTFVVEFLNGETCELKTITLNVGEGFESGSETGNADGGCKSSVALGVALPIALIGGVVLVKKKKED